MGDTDTFLVLSQAFGNWSSPSPNPTPLEFELLHFLFQDVRAMHAWPALASQRKCEPIDPVVSQYLQPCHDN